MLRFRVALHPPIRDADSGSSIGTVVWAPGRGCVPVTASHVPSQVGTSLQGWKHQAGYLSPAAHGLSCLCHGGEHHHFAPYKGIASGPVFTSHLQDRAGFMHLLLITPLECCLAPLSNSQMMTGPLSDMTRITKAAGGRAELDLQLQVLVRYWAIFRPAQKPLAITAEKSIYGLSKKNFRGLPKLTQQVRRKSRRYEFKMTAQAHL